MIWSISARSQQEVDEYFKRSSMVLDVYQCSSRVSLFNDTMSNVSFHSSSLLCCFNDQLRLEFVLHFITDHKWIRNFRELNSTNFCFRSSRGRFLSDCSQKKWTSRRKNREQRDNCASFNFLHEGSCQSKI